MCLAELIATWNLIDSKLGTDFTLLMQSQVEDTLQMEPGALKQRLSNVDKLRRNCFDQPMKEEPAK